MSQYIDTEAIPDDERDRLIAEAKKCGFRYNGADYVLRPTGIDSNELLNLMTGIALPARYGAHWPQRTDGVQAFPKPAGYVTDLRDGATFMLTDENDIGIAVYTRPQLEQARTAGVGVTDHQTFRGKTPAEEK